MAKSSAKVSAHFKPKYDWYQTASDVCLSVLIKENMRQNCSVNFESNKVCVSLTLSTGESCNLCINLANEVVPEKCSFKLLKSKIELKMRKKEGYPWRSLEAAGDDKNDVQTTVNKGSNDPVHVYPSSSHYTRNWDKLVVDIKKEEENEKPEGDAALNNLFQQIYSGGSDEVKKAMNKSFVESGGTVLSTNWDEVGTNKVEMKPPDGMEFKKYEI